MDCIVHGVAKSWTRLSNFHFTSLHKYWGLRLQHHLRGYNSTPYIHTPLSPHVWIAETAFQLADPLPLTSHPSSLSIKWGKTPFSPQGIYCVPNTVIRKQHRAQMDPDQTPSAPCWKPSLYHVAGCGLTWFWVKTSYCMRDSTLAQGSLAEVQCGNDERGHQGSFEFSLGSILVPRGGLTVQ